MGAPSIDAALKHFLAGHAPFSHMADEALQFLIDHAEVAYFGPGEVILGPSSDVAPYFHIVKLGRVHGLQDGRAEAIAFEAGPGDCFPVGALLAKRPVGLTYVSVDDTFVIRLPRPRFEELTRRSAVFLDFCTRRLASLLDVSRQHLQAAYAAQASAERTMAMPLGSLVRGAPVTCRPGDSLREAFVRMNAAQVGSIVVSELTANGEEVKGILTRTDLIGRVILPQVPLDTPISALMTRDVLTLPAQATAADAVLLMAEHSIRHVPVLDRMGAQTRVVGVVSERDLFALQRLSVTQLADALDRAGDVEALAAVAADVRRLSHHLVAQGVRAALMTRLISRLNDRLTQRLLALGAVRFALDAARFCWLAIGSEGRSEQTIATDQDNGIVYVAGALDRERLLAFAAWANEALARLGFPLCKGGIMARNPRWCATEAEWRRQFAEWIDRGDPQALLHASIFFDFRGVFGDKSLADRLREEVVALAARNSRFLKQMADNALRNRVPATGLVDALFGDGHAGPVDLKMHGTVPFVDAARIWALAAGLTETNTPDRLRRLADLNRLPRDDVQGWIDAFEFMQLMRLREQHRRDEQPEPRHDQHPNVVDPRRLSPLDRRILREAFRQARKIQQRLALDYPG